MFKKITKKLFGGSSVPGSSGGFFLNVRCSVCGEEFHLFINTSTDLIQNFDAQGGLSYSLKKEVVGGHCRNLIQVRMEFDGARRLLTKEIENGEFIEEP
jgi:hypothetical protein